MPVFPICGTSLILLQLQGHLCTVSSNETMLTACYTANTHMIALDAYQMSLTAARVIAAVVRQPVQTNAPADLPVLELHHDGILRGEAVGRLGHLEHLLQHVRGGLRGGRGVKGGFFRVSWGFKGFWGDEGRTSQSRCLQSLSILRVGCCGLGVGVAPATGGRATHLKAEKLVILDGVPGVHMLVPLACMRTTALVLHAHHAAVCNDKAG